MANRERLRPRPTSSTEEDIKRLLAAEDASSAASSQDRELPSEVVEPRVEHPKRLAVLSLALIAVSYICYQFVGSDLLPEMDEGGFIVDYIMPAGSSLAETNRVITHFEKILREVPEVESTSRRTGMQLGLASVTEANTGDVR